MMLRSDQDRTKLADDLLYRQQVQRDFIRQRDELRREIQTHERTFGVKSSDLHAALRDGRLRETSEVCDWIISYEVLQDMEANS